MRGYKPNLKCKKDIEVSNKKNNNFLELGMIQETCDCEKESCKNKQ